jgi:hypothetical protein
LESYAARHAVSANLDDSAWFSRTDLAAIFPLSISTSMSPGNPSVSTWSDSLRTYVSKVNAAEIKGHVAPLSYVTEQIRRILLQKRKMDVLSALRQSIQTDALRRGDYEIMKR